MNDIITSIMERYNINFGPPPVSQKELEKALQ
jgi:hypothetical protein